MLGLEVEFEVDSPRAVALQGSGGFTLFVEQRLDADFKSFCVITFRIDDVESFANALPAGKRTDVPLWQMDTLLYSPVCLSLSRGTGYVAYRSA